MKKINKKKRKKKQDKIDQVDQTRGEKIIKSNFDVLIETNRHHETFPLVVV